MAKKSQETQPSDDGGVAGNGSQEIGIPSRISSECDAWKWIDFCKYETSSALLYVTEDRNVFLQENASYAQNHAVKNNLKLFTLNSNERTK